MSVPQEIARLKKRRDFLRVAGAQCKWAAPGLILQSAPTPPPVPAGATLRVGFTCSKKVGNSVARNRARRRLRAATTQVLREAGLPGTDYVVIGRPQTLTRPYADLLADLRTAIVKVARGPRPQGSRPPSAKPPHSKSSGSKRSGAKPAAGKGSDARPARDQDGQE